MTTGHVFTFSRALQQMEARGMARRVWSSTPRARISGQADVSFGWVGVGWGGLGWVG